MRTIMMLASLTILGTGTFCLANSSVSFASVAFVVGLAVLFLGICELVVTRVAIVTSRGSNNEINAEGLVAVILGVVFLSGMIAEGAAVTAIFALWTTMEGVNSISNDNYHLRSNSAMDNVLVVIGIVSAVFGVYMFFNSLLYNLPVLMMVGISLFLIGVNRFRIALAIEYKPPQFLTGNQEKLHEAKLEEKRAMAKAKEAIRETKAAQEKISKLSKEIAKEQSLKDGMEQRRSAKR